MEYIDKKITFISHCPSKNTIKLTNSVSKVIIDYNLKVKLEIVSPLKINSSQIFQSSGVIIGTTENFGYIAGATKDFFDRCYNDLLEKTEGLPVFYYIRAGLDGNGSKLALNKILIGLKWRQVLEPIILKGNWRDEFIDQVTEACLNFAVGIDEGIY